MPGAPFEYLLIDISNSFTKLALATPERLGPRRRIPTPALASDSLRKLIGKWKFRRVIVSSVVPAKAGIVRESAGAAALWVSARIELGIGVEYPRPRTIGADRLANAAAVVALHGAPAVVVDFGTAVTFDVVSAGRNYIGGVIAPGLEAMTDYLHQRTALLPRIKLIEPVRAIGKSTRSAMLSGAVHGYRGLIKEILGEIRRELRPARGLKIVATGGYAALIASGLPAIQTVHPNLTLEGLRIIGNLNPV